jgi:hypothetical protein
LESRWPERAFNLEGGKAAYLSSGKVKKEKEEKEENANRS